MRNLEFSQEVFRTLDYTFESEHVENETIDYNGGVFKAKDTTFTDVKFLLSGPAANTVMFLKELETVNPGTLSALFKDVGMNVKVFPGEPPSKSETLKSHLADGEVYIALPEHTLSVFDHPENQVMRWSDLELKAIKEYAEKYARLCMTSNSGGHFPNTPSSKHLGSSLDDFLSEEGLSETVNASAEEAVRQLRFKEFADRKYGPAPDPAIPQHLRYATLYEAWCDGAASEQSSLVT